MARQRPSVIKRQREQTKRERQQMKAARRIERKTQDPAAAIDEAAIDESDGIVSVEIETIAPPAAVS